MDIQIKKGLLDVCVLACLKKGDSYGYQIIKDISALIEISESTLYPILKRLEASKQLTTYEEPHGGRIRKYFAITKNGMQKLKEFEAEWAELKKIYDYVKEST